MREHSELTGTTVLLNYKQRDEKLDIFKWISGPIIAFLTAICLYLMRVVVEFPEKYVQKTDFHPDSYMFKSDCQREAGKIYQENKEAHLEIFRKLDKTNETQSLILQELGKKADR